MALKDQFQKLTRHGQEFRGIPFWSWNDALRPDELSRQINEMAKAGLGGHFMHARTGLVTPYMSTDWMQAIKTSVEASKRAGIKAWLYDEENWPSGCGGGAVPALGEEYVCKRLRWQTIAPAEFKPQKRTIATFLIKPGSAKAPEVSPVDSALAARKAAAGQQILHFFYEPFGFSWATWPKPEYADLLNPTAMKAFIRHTHDAYAKAVGREFGKTVPGIFTDEPTFWDVPWPIELPRFFKKLKGYDLVPSLPLLALEIGDYRAFRYDFWHALLSLFIESYTRPVSQWCRKHKIAYTGHYHQEDNLAIQTRYIGAAMPHYEYMDIPGIDHLCRRITDPLLCKQVSSVAHQFGGRRVLSEMFGCAGWNVSFEELKWIAEWQFAQGIDLICEHLSLYSLRGCRKRDFPPSLHYQQPWWDDYKHLNDYFARLTFLLTRGKHVADVLVLHTIESAWAAYSPDSTHAQDELNRKLVDLTRALLGIHYDFDFGDETILAKHGRSLDGTLGIKNCKYRVVVLPPCVTLRGTTVQLLERFLARGGTVLLIGAPPDRMDGRPSAKPAEVLAGAVAVKPNASDLKAALEEVIPPRIEVLDPDGFDAAEVYVQQRDAGAEQIYFLANTSRENALTATVRLPGSGRLERWDPETGEAAPVRTIRRGKNTETTLEFASMGSHVLVMNRRKKPAAVRTPKARVIEKIALGGAWSIERSDPNALTLDYCSYRIGGGEWSAPTPVLNVQDNLCHILGAEVCEFRYTFTADFAAKRPPSLHLAIEEPAAYEISMNGLPVPTADLGWWRDISFRRLDVTHLLKPQDVNTIVLRRLVRGEAERKRLIALPETPPAERNRLRYGAEIESLYLLGEFLVRSRSPFEPLPRRAVQTAGPFYLTDPWGQTTTGNLVEQGLPFYAGSVRLTQAVTVSEKALRAARNATITMPVPDAITALVFVNGKPSVLRAWQPYEFPVGELLVPGRNEITIRLTGSCRNLLGPHHHVNGELYGVSPSDFRGVKSWIPGSAHPAGTWTDRYCLVQFGLTGPVTMTLWK